MNDSISINSIQTLIENQITKHRNAIKTINALKKYVDSSVINLIMDESIKQLSNQINELTKLIGYN